VDKVQVKGLTASTPPDASESSINGYERCQQTLKATMIILNRTAAPEIRYYVLYIIYMIISHVLSGLYYYVEQIPPACSTSVGG
jgi:hypothetical protein